MLPFVIQTHLAATRVQITDELVHALLQTTNSLPMCRLCPSDMNMPSKKHFSFSQPTVDCQSELSDHHLQSSNNSEHNYQQREVTLAKIMLEHSDSASHWENRHCAGGNFFVLINLTMLVAASTADVRWPKNYALLIFAT